MGRDFHPLDATAGGTHRYIHVVQGNAARQGMASPQEDETGQSRPACRQDRAGPITRKPLAARTPGSTIHGATGLSRLTKAGPAAYPIGRSHQLGASWCAAREHG
jgi:hypothetical protein